MPRSIKMNSGGIARSGMFAALMLAVTTFHSGYVYGQTSASPVLSEVSNNATFNWEVPEGGLVSGANFAAVNPSGLVMFILTATDVFLATDPYKDRVTFLGSRSSRNITFTMTNIQTSDNGTYSCRIGGVVISNCGQKLIVLGNPTTPGRPGVSSTPVYNQPVTLTCSSTSATVPADHGLTLTYSWQRDGTDVTPSPASPYSFTVNTRETQSYRCRGRESQGLESEWSPVYNMVPEYGPYQTSLTPSTTSYTVTEVQDTISPITCTANCRPGCNYRWLKNGTNYINSGTLSLGQAVRTQTGVYRCQSSNTHGTNDSSTVSVDVQYPPEVRLDTTGPADCRPYRVYVGQQNVQLICTVLAANPEVTQSGYRWKQNDSVIFSAASRILTIGSVSKTSGGSYTCQGSNIVGTSLESQPMSVVVQDGPAVSVPTSQTVTEGDRLSVTCSVVSDPASSVSWTKKNDNSFSPQTEPTLAIINIHRSHTGTYACTATNTLTPCGLSPIQRTDTGEIVVDVQYKTSITGFTANSLTGPVTVNEDDTVILTCLVDSNPRSTIRMLNGSREFTRADNSLITNTSWTAGCRQRGDYSCTASNNIGPAVERRIRLAVKCSPRADETIKLQDLYASRLSGNLTLTVTVLSYPVPTYTWRRTTRSSQNLSGSFTPVSDISGSISLKLTQLQEQDFGDYTLTVENGVGQAAVFVVKVVPESPPQKPTNLTVSSSGHGSLLVAWKQGFNGGLKQNFTVEYSTNKVTWDTAGTYDEYPQVESMQQTITDLTPSTTYYVRVIARNRLGDSGYTGAVSVITEGSSASDSQPVSSNTGVIAGAVAGCVVVIIIIAGIVIFMIRKGIRCVILTSDMEAARRRADNQNGENMDAQDRSTRDSRTDPNTQAHIYSELSGDVGKQTYTELKTNMKPQSDYENMDTTKMTTI